MDKPAPDLHFRVMSLVFKIRDLLVPRKNILTEVEIKPGYQVLDYGCGPGSYVAATAELVGQSGRIFALDIHPLAIQMVDRLTSRKHLTNVETICSHCETGLPDRSLDVVLLYDTFHDLGEPNRVLEELHRILKPDGILSFSDHHMKEDEIVPKFTSGGLFELSGKGKKTYSFSKP